MNSRSKNQEIMEFEVLGFENNEIGILLYQNEAEKINKAIKSIIQIHFPHIWPKFWKTISVGRGYCFGRSHI